MKSLTKLFSSLAVILALIIVVLQTPDTTESLLDDFANTENLDEPAETDLGDDRDGEDPEGENDRYRVLRVVDGDTIHIAMDGTSVSVRMIGLDTPETVHPNKPVECFGREASDKAKALLTDQWVTIETDPTQGEYDRYNRLLAYVYMDDGTLFNQYMIAQGYGYEYTYDTPYAYQAQFKDAQQHAEQNDSGLWADDICENDA